MKRQKGDILASVILIIISVFFFYKTVFFGLIPFPGDLLVSEYNPWRSYSYLGYNPASYPSKVQYFDTLRQMYPWRTFSNEVLKSGSIPLWNPYNFSGSPLMANVQSAVFYPLSVLYFVFPQLITWTIFVLLQPLLAAFFTYLYMRKIGAQKIGSILASVAYAFSLYMSVFLEYNTIGHVILWLPLSLYFLEFLFDKLTIYRVLGFVAGIVVAFLAGHIQLFGFSFIFILLYSLFKTLSLQVSTSKKVKEGIFFVALHLIALGIVGVQLLPTIELIGFSARVSQNYQFLIEKLLIQPYQLGLFFSPDIFGNPATRNYLIPDTYPGNALYIGIIPIIFALFAIFKVKDWHKRFFAIAAGVLLILFIRTPISELFYKLKIPFFSTGSPTNAIFLLSFSLAVLSGIGIELWIKRERLEKIFFVIFGLICLLWLQLYIFYPQIVSKKNLLYSSGLLTIFFAIILVSVFVKKKKQVFGVLLIIITVFDLFYFFQKFNPFVPSKLVFPEAAVFSFLKEKSGINRFWGYGSANIQANFATQYSLFSSDGYDPLYPKWYGEFIEASKNGKLAREFNNQIRSDAQVAGGFGELDLSSNKNRLRVLDILGVKYVLDKTENQSTGKTFPPDRFQLVYDRDGWRIFENINAAPRAFLADNYKVFKSKEEFEKVFFAKEFDPLKTILLEKEPRTVGGGEGLVSTVSYTPSIVRLKTQTDSPKLLFLSDTYYPGWKAYVDGRETEIYRANYAFRAVAVPRGAHWVVFEYKPESFADGVKLTIISIVALLVLGILVDRKKVTI